MSHPADWTLDSRDPGRTSTFRDFRHFPTVIDADAYLRSWDETEPYFARIIDSFAVAR